MKDGLLRALRIYKYLSIAFVIGYSILVVVDDYALITKHWKTSWLLYLQLWIVYFFMYFIVFSFYYWLTSLLIVFVYTRGKNN